MHDRSSRKGKPAGLFQQEIGLFKGFTFVAICAILPLGFSPAGEVATALTTPALMIKFSESAQTAVRNNGQARNRLLSRLSRKVQHSLDIRRLMSGNTYLLSLEKPVDKDELQLIIEQLRQDPSIDAVEADDVVYTFADPSDYYFENQWTLHPASRVPGSINLPSAWELSKGSAETVVAVIDTGILPEHVDLKGRLVEGYDFISDFEVGDNSLLGQYPVYMQFFRTNDGDGRDPDPSDPGDWVDLDDSRAMMSVGYECEVHDSTFHGTAIAGIIAANSDQHHGITGIDWNARILPVRVSGKCGGSRSDMVDAIRWAAGVSDPALPENPNPAQVINISLGTNSSCTFAEQEAIDDARAAGAIIIAAAGNQANNLDIIPTAPASCENVISVTAVRNDGSRSYYSNYGTMVDIAAPGGEDAANEGLPLIVASNRGVHEPVEGSHYKHVAGTSAAAAHVSGIVSLMIGANPDLTPHQIERLLLQSSRPFPENGLFSCDQLTCGDGLADGHSAVKAAIAGYVDGFEPPLASASDGREDDDEPRIETGISGGCSLVNGADSHDPSLYLILLGLCLYRVIRRAD